MNKKKAHFDLQSLGFWSLKNATKMADIVTSEKDFCPFPSVVGCTSPRSKVPLEADDYEGKCSK
jgi:hypothetical protein